MNEETKKQQQEEIVESDKDKEKTVASDNFIDATNYFAEEEAEKDDFHYQPSDTGLGVDFDPKQKIDKQSITTEVKDAANPEDIYGTTIPENSSWGSSATLVWEISDHIPDAEENKMEEKEVIENKEEEQTVNQDEFQTVERIADELIEVKEEKKVPEFKEEELDTKSPLLDEADNLSVFEGGKIRLPNGKQNELYEVNLSDHTKDLIGELSLENGEEVGIIFDNEKRVISGIPKKEGDFELKLLGARKDGKNLSVILQIFINPDPKTLWKALEPDPELPYQKSHSDYKRIEQEIATLTAGRIRGRSHAQKALFCDDDFKIAFDEIWGFVGIVCDGAGSSKFSREASRVISSNVAKHFLAHIRLLNPESLKNFLRAWHRNENNDKILEGQYWATKWSDIFRDRIFTTVLNESLTDLEDTVAKSPRAEGRNPKDFYTTLLFFWAFPVDENWFLFSYQVGDGAMAVKDGNKFVLLNVPDSGEYSGQTKFLTKDLFTPKEISDRCRFGFYSNLSSVWACSDGISDPKFSSDAALGESKNWESLEQEVLPNLVDEKKLLEYLGFWSQGEHDDRTICVLEVKK